MKAYKKQWQSNLSKYKQQNTKYEDVYTKNRPSKKKIQSILAWNWKQNVLENFINDHKIKKVTNIRWNYAQNIKKENSKPEPHKPTVRGSTKY